MTTAERETLAQLRRKTKSCSLRSPPSNRPSATSSTSSADFQEKLDEQMRVAARQAAPFRRRKSQRAPDGSKKRPGRPKGHPGVYRSVPDHVDEHVEVPLAGCPCCGGPSTQVEAIEQFIEEIPPVRPHVTRLVTYRGGCAGCGEVHSSHPLQTSTATGAAKTQLGPRAPPWRRLNKQFGLTIARPAAS